MRRLALVLLLAGCASRATDPQTYDNNDAELAVGNAARMTCSCLFVMKMPDDFCAAWVKASPNVARFNIDKEKKIVEGVALLQWGARAHFVDEKRGCVLE
ncbi:MAG: uncharacterized protein H6Q89_5368 [Myxococcaceae bacterium]|nr:uncharacterized protein [Myxococcaceae bacterium]